MNVSSRTASVNQFRLESRRGRRRGIGFRPINLALDPNLGLNLHLDLGLILKLPAGIPE